MGSQTVTIEIPEEIRTTVQETADYTGRDFSSVVSEMLTEGVKMRQFVGIVFADGLDGRRARIAGTEIEVCQVIGDYNVRGEEWEQLRAAYPALSEQQLRTALAYAEAYPAEIEAQLDADNRAYFEAFWAKHPATRPPWR